MRFNTPAAFRQLGISCFLLILVIRNTEIGTLFKDVDGTSALLLFLAINFVCVSIGNRREI